MASQKPSRESLTIAELVMDVTKMKDIIAAQQEEIARNKEQVEQNEWTIEENAKFYQKMFAHSIKQTEQLEERLAQFEKDFSAGKGGNQTSKVSNSNS